MADTKIFDIFIDDNVKELVVAGILIGQKIEIQASNDLLWDEIREVSNRYQATLEGKEPSDILELQYSRDLYKSIGVNPTKTRPSSEALLRRVMQDKELYRINNLVDVMNLESLQYLLPVGLYDIDKITGTEILIRKGLEHESFEGIRKADVNVGGRLCVSDIKGAFGSPTSDSARTAISDDTTSALAIIYAPPTYPLELFYEMLDEGARRMKQYCKADILVAKLLNIKQQTI